MKYFGLEKSGLLTVEYKGLFFKLSKKGVSKLNVTTSSLHPITRGKAINISKKHKNIDSSVFLNDYRYRSFPVKEREGFDLYLDIGDVTVIVRADGGVYEYYDYVYIDWLHESKNLTLDEVNYTLLSHKYILDENIQKLESYGFTAAKITALTPEEVSMATKDDFHNIMSSTFSECSVVLSSKNDEYAKPTNRFHNFEQGVGRNGNETREQVLLNFKMKHDISVEDLVKDLGNGKFPTKEYLDEKIGDSINYLVLLKASIYDGIKKINNDLPF